MNISTIMMNILSRNRIFLLSLILLSFLNSCKKETTDTPINNEDVASIDTSAEFKVLYPEHTGWTYNQNIYEVNVRQYTPEGTFKAFEDHLPRLQSMGVGILWFMPIYPIGELNRKGELGSYYSVMDYEKVNPEFGSRDDFKSIVKEAHAAGMYVVIDWVANHTSWDNVLTNYHDDYYLKTEEGDFRPPIGHDDWTDVIQLDYENENLQEYMIQVLKYWVVETGIDGFRFDYVDGIPTSFWRKVNAELKELKSDIFLIAEGDGTKYHQMGFDMDYCWSLHGWDVGLMRQIFEGSKNVADLDNFLNAEETNYMPEKYHMYFTSNHDENSWHGTEFEQLGTSSEVFAVLTQTLYGMPLIYSGQEAALNRRLDFFNKDEISWNNLVYEDFYTAFNTLRATNEAMWNGNSGGLPVRVHTSMDENIFAFSRSKGSDTVLVLLNLSDSLVQFNISDSIYNGSYLDLITNQSTDISTDNPINLDAWEYQVLVK